MTSLKLLDWLMPCILGAAVWFLKDISREISDINKSLAVVVSKIDNHEVRISTMGEQIRILEDKEARYGPPRHSN